MSPKLEVMTSYLEPVIDCPQGISGWLAHDMDSEGKALEHPCVGLF